MAIDEAAHILVWNPRGQHQDNRGVSSQANKRIGDEKVGLTAHELSVLHGC